MNQILQRLADNHDVYWIDFGYQSVNSDGTIPRELMPDYLHLSPKGYEIWAEAIEDKLAGVLGDSPVKAAANAGAGLTGEWTWTMQTPNGPVTAPLILRQEGDSVKGKFARDQNRWPQIENGKVNGNEFSWIVKRDRPDGSSITYRMSGQVEGDKITAIAKTELDGQENTNEWSATRK